MKSLIEQLLPFEIYLRALSWALIVASLIQRWWNALMKRKKQTSKDENSLLVWEDHQSNTIQQEDLYEESLKNNHYWETKEQNENLSDYSSNHQSIEEEITHKLLKQVVWESDDYKEIIEKKEDINEDDSSSKNDSDSTVWEQSQSKASPLSPEIYNINTNHESINKQKIAYEIVKHEIDTLKTRNLRVEYEKKLIEATMNFPEENEFHISLGDRYIERWEFKKAQSLFKKLHLLDENDDRILYKLWVINLELQDFVSAEYLLTRAQELKPENPKYYQLLAEVKYNLEKIEESIQLMEKAVDLRPWKFEYIEVLWRLYKEVDNIHLYYKTLLKLNALDPLNTKVKAELAKFKQ